MERRSQPLPGLLDDPLFQVVSAQRRSDLHIAPLRNPIPTLTSSGPSPLEPKASGDLGSTSGKVKLDSQQTPGSTRKRTPSITPASVIQAQDTRKPITAISELLESTTSATTENDLVQLPSFVSLSAVENKNISPPTTGEELRASKRLRLDPDLGSLDDYIHLPRPQQQNQGPRAPPLLPTIVNGIHEPPPNAALLPPMETNTHSRICQTQTTGATRPAATERTANARPPEKMLNSPAMERMEKVHGHEHGTLEAVEEKVLGLSLMGPLERQPKTRKAPHKWTDEETRALLQGVEKHGSGKWKSILDDEAFPFENRTAVDLKDRYRVCTSGHNKSRNDIEIQRAAEPLTPSSASTINILVSSDEAKDQLEPHSGNDVYPAGSLSVKATVGRRMRRAWTSEEDENLLKGVAKHGFQWTAIHDDPDLDLSHRKATDLRDRIRNKYPDGYKNAETAPPKWQMQRTASKKNLDAKDTATSKSKKLSKDRPSRRKTTSREASGGSKSSGVEGADGSQEQPSRTLPPLDIDDDDWDWSNNTLPPLLDWEEMGILSCQSGQ
jgi:hypothetical protein